MTVGVLAIQGDFEKHRDSLSRIGVASRPVRTLGHLAEVERLIIPGGESTTVGLLLERYGLGDEIQRRVRSGMPIWGTCMGMIMMAHTIENRTQYSLDLLDITVRRNAFGAQVHSFEDSVFIQCIDEGVTGVFIRAPIVTECGPDVRILARYEDQIVAVQQGGRLGTSFHPELTDDVRLHEYFMSI